MRRPWPDPTTWNATADEVAGDYPCDALMVGGFTRVTRAIDVAAELSHVFRWLCQLRIAPYSYDLVDNLGRRSPTTLTPGADELGVGQRFLVFRIAGFERDAHITGRSTRGFSRLYGDLACSYSVRRLDRATTRLVARLDVADPPTPVTRLRRRALLWGDLVMTRKQLLVLKQRAESTSPTRGHAA